MLDIDYLCIDFQERHWNFNLRLEKHGTYVLLGRSGSGKSTFLNLLGGYLPPASGDVRWNNQSLIGLEPHERPVTTLFQSHNLFDHLSVWNNIALGVDPGLKLNDEQRHRIEHTLSAVGLAGYAGRKPAELSGGEQQRVALARCLLREKPLLLLDEPFSALDPGTRDEMMALLRNVIERLNPCLVMISHDQSDVQALGAKTLMMQGDCVVEVLQ